MYFLGGAGNLWLTFTHAAVKRRMTQSEFEPVLRKLTVNAAITLKFKKDPAAGECLGSVHTGLGKYTSLAAGGVISNLRVNGMVEERGEHRTAYLTDLGARVARHLAENWDEVHHLLRDPVPPRLR